MACMHIKEAWEMVVALALRTEERALWGDLSLALRSLEPRAEPPMKSKCDFYFLLKPPIVSTLARFLRTTTLHRF